MRVALAIAMLTVLSGCASYGDIRAGMPATQREIAKAAEPLSACMLDGLRVKYASGDFTGKTFTPSNRDGTFHIAEQLNGFFGPQSFEWDLAFTPIAPSMTRVELRSIHNVWGETREPIDMWDLLAACS